MTSTRNAVLAGEIRAEAARQQVTGRELARRTGLPETTCARYLRGGTAMSIDDVELFAAALDVSTVDLIVRAYGQPLPTPDPDTTNPCLSHQNRHAPVILGPWSDETAVEASSPHLVTHVA